MRGRAARDQELEAGERMNHPVSIHTAELLSRTLDLLLAAAWFFFVVLLARARSTPLKGYVVATIAAVALTYALAHVNRWFDLWPPHKYFPSGHETLAASLGTSLAWRDRRWLWLAIPLAAVLAIALVRAGWHTWLDIGGAVAFSPVVTFGLLRTLDREDR